MLVPGEHSERDVVELRGTADKGGDALANTLDDGAGRPLTMRLNLRHQPLRPVGLIGRVAGLGHAVGIEHQRAPAPRRYRVTGKLAVWHPPEPEPARPAEGLDRPVGAPQV